MKPTSDIPDVKCFNVTGISAPVGNHCRKSKTVLKIYGQQLKLTILFLHVRVATFIYTPDCGNTNQYTLDIFTA